MTGAGCQVITLGRHSVRVLSSDSAALKPEFGILSGRWSQYPDVTGLPFDAMWCVVPPGSRSNEDFHPEIELAIVVAGSARIETPGDAETVEVGAGAAALLGSQERHVIHNGSSDEPLVLLSIYWMPGQTADPAVAVPIAADAIPDGVS
jgi:mannose-6-phosphate isomerase-like protein (cupin superfamily)